MSGEPITETIDADIEDLVASFLEHRRRDLDLARHALAAGDMEQLYSIGHTIKGTAGSFGFLGLARIGGALEEAGSTGDNGAAQRLTEEMAHYLEHLQVRYH